MRLLLRPTLLAVVLAPLCAQDEAAFDEGYGQVRALLDKQQWQQAKDALDSLLAAHEGAVYAIAERDALLEDCKRIEFGLEFKTPTAKEL